MVRRPHERLVSNTQASAGFGRWEERLWPRLLKPGKSGTSQWRLVANRAFGFPRQCSWSLDRLRDAYRSYDSRD